MIGYENNRYEIRTLTSHHKFKLGDKVKVKYDLGDTLGVQYYKGTITKLLTEYDKLDGSYHPMFQLNNDEFHTYYVEYLEFDD